MKEDIVPATPGAYSEEYRSDDFNVLFAFEPDPDFVKGQIGFDEAAHSYMVCRVTDQEEEYALFFKTLDEMEKYANLILDYVKDHRQQGRP